MIQATWSHVAKTVEAIRHAETFIDANPDSPLLSLYITHACALRSMLLEMEVIQGMTPEQESASAAAQLRRVKEMTLIAA